MVRMWGRNILVNIVIIEVWIHCQYTAVCAQRISTMAKESLLDLLTFAGTRTAHWSSSNATHKKNQKNCRYRRCRELQLQTHCRLHSKNHPLPSTAPSETTFAPNVLCPKQSWNSHILHLLWSNRCKRHDRCSSGKPNRPTHSTQQHTRCITFRSSQKHSRCRKIRSSPKCTRRFCYTPTKSRRGKRYILHFRLLWKLRNHAETVESTLRCEKKKKTMH